MLGISFRFCSRNPANGKVFVASIAPSANFGTSSRKENRLIKTEHLPKGSGGRSSFSGNVVTVFGATGMMGRIICNRLGKEGTQMVIPYRGDDWDARSVKVAADLGQVLFQDFDLRDPERIRKAIRHSNIVINCIGTNYETSNFSYRDVHVEGARLIAKIAKECNVEKLIHFSSLNASPSPSKIFLRPSTFLTTKYEGEEAVRSEFEDAVIVRPSNIYGEGDRFLFYYTREARRNMNFSIPLWRKGEMTIKMPVHQSDVADGIMKILHNKDIKGSTFDFVGPDTYLLSEIIDYMFQVIMIPVKRSHISPIRLAQFYACEKFLKRPSYTLDVLEREFISDSLSAERNQTLRDLIGDKFRRFDQMAGWHLKVFNKYSYYNEKLGEFPEPKPPKQLSEDFEFQLRRKLRLSL